MTRLSVNINKIALLRNSRGSDYPNVVQVAKDCERFGAEGITVHPRPDERHIRYQDVYDLKEVVTTELNVEGHPNARFMEVVREVKPDQCTLVPDDPNQLTSDHGWDTLKNKFELTDIIDELKELGIRTAIFIDPIEQFLEGAKEVGTDRIEFYTGPYAKLFSTNELKAVEPFAQAAKYCDQLELGVNAGHDLNLQNLQYFQENLPNLLEVSIGHALINESIYLGLENVIQLYLRQLTK